MKRKFYIVILLLAMVTASNATDYFVDPNAASGGDGLSWSTALKTVQLADIKMASSTANTDRVFVKGTEIPFGSVSWSPKSQNYFFSCVGTETQPDERPKSDKDGNGTIEAWEFTYPSVITYTLPTSGTVINFAAGSSSIIDGVTISGNASANDVLMTVVNWTGSSSALTASVFQNSIISNNNITYTNNTKAIYGALLKIADNGEVKNCLIEKNRLVCANTVNLAPVTMVSLYLSTYSNSAPNITNAVIRNNYESITVTGVTATDRIQAFVIGAYGGGANATSGIATMANCLVYNNDLSFSNPSALTSNITSIAGSMSGMNYGKVVLHNCAFANNKLTNIKSGIYLSRSANFGYELINNVFWNNPNTFGGETSSAGVTVSSTLNGLYNASNFSNNVLDVEKPGVKWGEAIYANNLYDLAQINTGTKAPYYSNPTTFVGSNRVAGSADSIAIAQARWSLGVDSYLATKGLAFSGISTDLIGNQFSASTPSVGPYQYIPNTASFTLKSIEMKSRLVRVESRNLITLSDQPISVHTTLGVLIYSGEGKGKVVNLEKSGMYIVSTAKDAIVNKIMVY